MKAEIYLVDGQWHLEDKSSKDIGTDVWIQKHGNEVNIRINSDDLESYVDAYIPLPQAEFLLKNLQMIIERIKANAAPH
jgi:very-short-patch-repair endonuclease